MEKTLGFIAVALFGLSAQAQTFPAVSSTSWVPFRCGTEVMTDPYADENGATNERDLVGDLAAPTAYRASDAQYLYLRMRLDEDPIPGGNPRPFAWGLLLDLDGDLQDYELQLLANGIGGTVAVYRNTLTTLPNDPTDPPDEPEARIYSLSTNARSIVAPGSNYGTSADYFLEFAIPWQDLSALGLTSTTPVTAWAATSSTSTTLNGDFACWDDDANAGEPTLAGTATGSTVLDGRADSDNDGYTDASEYAAGTNAHDASVHPGGDPDALQLAGGGGCTSAFGGTALGALLACAGLIRRRSLSAAAARPRR